MRVGCWSSSVAQLSLNVNSLSWRCSSLTYSEKHCRSFGRSCCSCSWRAGWSRRFGGYHWLIWFGLENSNSRDCWNSPGGSSCSFAGCSSGCRPCCHRSWRRLGCHTLGSCAVVTAGYWYRSFDSSQPASSDGFGWQFLNWCLTIPPVGSYSQPAESLCRLSTEPSPSWHSGSLISPGNHVV